VCEKDENVEMSWQWQNLNFLVALLQLHLRGFQLLQCQIAIVNVRLDLVAFATATLRVKIGTTKRIVRVARNIRTAQIDM
jgi:hypothetical protein